MGVALLRAKTALDKVKAEGDEAIGVNIIARATEAPLRQLITNAAGDASIVVAKVLEQDGNAGYNVATDEYVDMLDAGVIDPTKVTRSALQHASSIAGLLLTTECLVTDIPEPEPAGGGHDHHGHGGGMPGMM